MPDEEVKVVADKDKLVAVENIASDLQAAVRDACGAEVPIEMLGAILRDYPEGKIREKIDLIRTAPAELKNVPGWLLVALKEDYEHVPGRGRDPGGGKKKKMVTKGAPPRSDKEKELIRSLYFS